MSKDTDCPRQLTPCEILEEEWDEYSIDEIKHLIKCGVVSNEDIAHYYNNSQWDEQP